LPFKRCSDYKELFRAKETGKEVSPWPRRKNKKKSETFSLFSERKKKNLSITIDFTLSRKSFLTPLFPFRPPFSPPKKQQKQEYEQLNRTQKRKVNGYRLAEQRKTATKVSSTKKK